jgi:phospholipase/carboxylesterase
VAAGNAGDGPAGPGVELTDVADPHAGHPPLVAGAPLARARAIGVLVHGRDQGPEVMIDVAERLGLEDVGYVLPVAAARSWYPGRYFDPVAANEPHVSSALAAFDAAIDLACQAGVAVERIVLAGFSQGACLVAELMARCPRRFAGVAVLTGTLLGPDGDEIRPQGIEGTPMFFASSRYDEWIALERASSTALAFERAGARVVFETYDDREHHVSDRAVSGLRSLFS